MPSVSFKGGISFGLVYMPVALYKATQDNDIHFNKLHKEDHSRIRYKQVCGNCDKEVSNADIVKGYEYEDGRYIIVSDEEIEAMKTENDKTVKIEHFTSLDTIPPVYFDASYHIVPQKGGEKSFELLRQIMIKTNKVAVGKMVLGSKETLLALIPTDDGILFETLFFADEVRDLPKTFTRPEVNEEELKLGTSIIEAMDKPFDPALYQNEFQQRLSDLIAQKAENEEIVFPKEPEHSNKIIDIMEAMKQTADQLKQKEKKSEKRPARRKPKGA